jgi:small subunit ribosomal protein S10
MSKQVTSKPILRIRLKSYDHKLLDQVTEDIMSKMKLDDQDNSRIRGPFPLPTTINRWTVLRGPHVNKKSREQFERRTHHRLIDIVDFGTSDVEVLKNWILPAGIYVNIKSLKSEVQG